VRVSRRAASAPRWTGRMLRRGGRVRAVRISGVLHRPPGAARTACPGTGGPTSGR